MKIPLSQLELKTVGELECSTNIDYVFGVETAGPFFAEKIGRCNVETAAALCLDSAHRIACYSVAAIGRINEVDDPVPQIMRAALLSNASYIVVAHNHPSGVGSITDPDIALTRRISSAAKLFGIKLIDSIIVTPDGAAVSIRESLVDERE